MNALISIMFIAAFGISIAGFVGAVTAKNLDIFRVKSFGWAAVVTALLSIFSVAYLQ